MPNLQLSAPLPPSPVLWPPSAATLLGSGAVRKVLQVASVASSSAPAASSPANVRSAEAVSREVMEIDDDTDACSESGSEGGGGERAAARGTKRKQ